MIDKNDFIKLNEHIKKLEYFSKLMDKNLSFLKFLIAGSIVSLFSLLLPDEYRFVSGLITAFGLTGLTASLLYGLWLNKRFDKQSNIVDGLIFQLKEEFINE